MLNKKYSIFSYKNETYENQDIKKILKKFTAEKLNYDWRLVNDNYESDFETCFGMDFKEVGMPRMYDFLHSEKVYRKNFRIINELTIRYFACEFIIVDGFGNLIDPKILLDEYYKKIGFEKLKERAIIRLSHNSKGNIHNKRRVRGSCTRKPKKSSFKKELRDNINAQEEGVKINNKRNRLLKHFLLESGVGDRKKEASWKDKKSLKQWSKNF